MKYHAVWKAGGRPRRGMRSRKRDSRQLLSSRLTPLFSVLLCVRSSRYRRTFSAWVCVSTAGVRIN